MDASLEEEACSLVQLLVSVNGENNICAMQKVGQGALDADSIFEMIEVGKHFYSIRFSVRCLVKWFFFYFGQEFCMNRSFNAPRWPGCSNICTQF